MADYFEEARQTDTTMTVTAADTTPETTALAAPSTEGPTIMAYPPGVSLATITIGAGRTMFGAAPKLISATVTPIFVGTPHVVHAASGWAFYPTPRTFRVENGEELTFELPHVDAEGWRDTAGNEFPALLETGERDRGWAYHAKFTVIGGSGQDAIPHRYEKVFQPLVGQTEPLDIDLVPDGQIGQPVSTPVAVVTSIDGQVGAVDLAGTYLTAEDGAALADAAGDQAVLDAGSYTDESLGSVRTALTPSNGNRPVGKGELVVNVLDHGVMGDGSTDDVAAIEAIAEQVADSGGGTLLFPRGTYIVSRSIYCHSNIDYVGDQAIIKNTAPTTRGPLFRGAFVPGYIHGFGFFAGNANGFARVPVQSVARGSATVTATSAGGFSTVQVGNFVAVRSLSNYSTATVEIPSQLYFTKVVAKSGDTLTLADGSPYAITDAMVHPLVGNPLDGQGAVMRMVENVSITGFGIDALFPVWGGGCYGFKMSRIRPMNRDTFSSLVTLNAMIHFEVTECHGDWYYTFCELALGCSDGWVHDNQGTYRLGTSLFHPVSITESSHNVRFERNTLMVGQDFAGASLSMFNLAHNQDVRVRDNLLTALGAMDSVFGVGGATVPERELSGFRAEGNTITVGANVSRGFAVGVASGTTHPPIGFMIRDNIIKGQFKASPNEWIWLQTGQDFVVDGNIVPDGAGQRVGPATRGRFNGGDPSSSSGGHIVTPSAMMGYVTASTLTKTLGRVMFRGSVSFVRVQVTTPFDTAGALRVGTPTNFGAYATGIDLSVAGVKFIFPGHANAGVELGARLATASRDVLGVFTPTSAAPTAGAAFITVYYEPNTPPAA